MKITKYQKAKLNGLLRELIKKRDGYRCLRCDKDGEHNVLHSSHIYPKGSNRGLEFDLDNLKFLCFHCHYYWWHKHPIEAGDWIKRKLPKNRLRRLANKKEQVIKMDYKKLKKKLEEQINE